jgi:hypothetical protein
MKRFLLSILAIQIMCADVTQVLAGTLTVNGSLAVTTNLTAQSITLGGVTQTNWNFLPLQGNQYVIVPAGTNDLDRGNNLLAAYTTATTLGPAASNRVVVLIPPGSYNLSGGLYMGTMYVDLIGLVPAQMTAKQVFTDSSGKQRTETIAKPQCPVLIYCTNDIDTIDAVDNVRIESVMLTNYTSDYTSAVAFNADSVNDSNSVLRHVSISSIDGFHFSGEYVDCVGDFNSDYDASGTFVDCVSVNGDAGFTANVVNGTFIGCVGGDGSFGEGDTAAGTFVDCVGGAYSFGGYGTASGSFKGCVGGDESFGGYGTASGSFNDCVGGGSSFGGGSGGSIASSAKLRHCQAGTGSFGNYNEASQDFNYNVAGTNTFLMLPQLPTTTNGLPSGTVYNSSGTLKVMP